MKSPTTLLTLFLWACHSATRYPTGGYPYPQHLDPADTNYYYYPLKKIASRKDSFWRAYDHDIYQFFDERNLSIRPLTKDVFRLTYGEAFGYCVIITITKDTITVKKGNLATMSTTDETRLNDLEQRHLHLLEARFPLDAPRKNPRTHAQMSCARVGC